MFNIKKHWKPVALSLGLASVTFVAGGFLLYDSSNANIKLGSERLSEYEFRERYEFVASTYGDYGIDLNLNQALKENIQNEIAQKMLKEEAHRKIADDLGVKVSGSEVSSYLKENNFKSKKALVPIQNKMTESFLLNSKISNKIVSNLESNEEDLKKYFEENKENYIKPQSLDFDQLIFEDKQEAEKAAKTLNGSTSLDAFKDKEGVNVLSGVMDKKDEKSRVSEIVFSTKEGSWTNVIENGSNYHLYKVLKHHKEDYYQFDEIKELILKDYVVEKASIEYQQRIEKIYEKNEPSIKF